jgi:hypothetical protein
MKNIKALFLKQQEKNPLWGDYVCLVEAVRGKKFSRYSLTEALRELVPEISSFQKSEKILYLDFLYLVSNPLRSN